MLDYKGYSLFLPRFYKFLRREPREVLEPLLLFGAFFLPGYLFQNREVDPLLFNSAGFHFMYLVQTLPAYPAYIVYPLPEKSGLERYLFNQKLPPGGYSCRYTFLPEYLGCAYSLLYF